MEKNSPQVTIEFVLKETIPDIESRYINDSDQNARLEKMILTLADLKEDKPANE